MFSFYVAHCEARRSKRRPSASERASQSARSKAASFPNERALIARSVFSIDGSCRQFFLLLQSLPSAPRLAPPSSPASRQTPLRAGRSPLSAKEHYREEGAAASSFDVKTRREAATGSRAAKASQRHSLLFPFFLFSFRFFVGSAASRRSSAALGTTALDDEEKEEKKKEKRKRKRKRKKNASAQSVFVVFCDLFFLSFTFVRSFAPSPLIECSSRASSLREPR